MTSPPHPLAPLTKTEFDIARTAIKNNLPANTVLFFRAIFLHEPPKAELVPFLAIEHAGNIEATTLRPARLANVEYDVVSPSSHVYTSAIVNLESKVVRTQPPASGSHPYYTTAEFSLFQDACISSPLFKEAMSEFILPRGFSITIDPWPYGSADGGDPARYMQGLVFARDTSKNHPDSNHYTYPVPIIPVMDWVTKKIIRVDRLPTGGAGDPLLSAARGGEPKKLFEHSVPAEYVPELLSMPLRDDLKPLNIVQPRGASFSVHADNLVEWQKWRFRLSFTPREGAVLHDVCYDGRPVLYRLSYSELTVPYADPRPPFHRKHAFDCGDGGLGRASNNLRLGCDCVGAVHYFDSLLAAPDGSPSLADAVVCLHEQDQGILSKHTNFRTSRAVVTRARELVVQFIATLANYEYILAFKLDLSGTITIETRATGVMSVVAIDEGKKSPYGNVVGAGVLAQNHQHIFAVRIDPSIDSYAQGDTKIVIEESAPRPVNQATNPHGNFYEIEQKTVEKARWIDAAPFRNRTIRMENPNRQNEMSGRNVAYKLVPSPTQLLLADEASTVAKRAPFARHHVWVTGYRDGELWAAGEFTNQSAAENGGVESMVRRGDWFVEEADGEGGDGGKKSTPVVWSVFGFTHNPRVEDWPVMPAEIHQLHLKPSDFFAHNPALDAPSTPDEVSIVVPCCDVQAAAEGNKPAGPFPEKKEFQQPKWFQKRILMQENPATHQQGPGPDISLQDMGASTEKEGNGNGQGRRKTVAGLVVGLVDRLKRTGPTGPTGPATGGEVNGERL